MIKYAVIFFVLLFFSIKSAFAISINKIFIKGNQRIDSSTILSYLNIKKNKEISEEDLNAIFKDLFATELFSDISFEFKNDSLFIKVVENPIINRIALEGNKRIDDEDILSEIFLNPRDIFTLNKVKNSLQTILGIYRGNGRYAAIVEPKVIYLEQNRVDLIFEIEEGPLSKIKFINFLGNSFFQIENLEVKFLLKNIGGGKFYLQVVNLILIY